MCDSLPGTPPFVSSRWKSFLPTLHSFQSTVGYSPARICIERRWTCARSTVYFPLSAIMLEVLLILLLCIVDVKTGWELFIISRRGPSRPGSGSVCGDLNTTIPANVQTGMCTAAGSLAAARIHTMFARATPGPFDRYSHGSAIIAPQGLALRTPAPLSPAVACCCDRKDCLSWPGTTRISTGLEIFLFSHRFRETVVILLPLFPCGPQQLAGGLFSGMPLHD